MRVFVTLLAVLFIGRTPNANAAGMVSFNASTGALTFTDAAGESSQIRVRVRGDAQGTIDGASVT